MDAITTVLLGTITLLGMGVLALCALFPLLMGAAYVRRR